MDTFIFEERIDTYQGFPICDRIRGKKNGTTNNRLVADMIAIVVNSYVELSQESLVDRESFGTTIYIETQPRSL